MKLSVALITYNEEINISRFLDAVNPIADEIIIVDSFSNDKTKEIALQYSKVKFFEKKFEGYGEQKNYAINLCSGEWILFLDADEVPNDELKKSILSIIKDKNSAYKVYKIKLENYLGNHHIKYGGWGNIWRERLFMKNAAAYSDDKIHEHLVTSEKKGVLPGFISHYTYKSISHHVQKINQYSEMMADKMFERGKKINRAKILINPAFEFIKVFFFKLGFLDGFPGFYIATTMSYYTFLKYIKLYTLVKNYNIEHSITQ